jgi:alkanesulfonate monooxygenase SsuD/methylene tetrahydromethanopterin reductase-like flavin-dependent oxidoreductase (luciferase family)
MKSLGADLAFGIFDHLDIGGRPLNELYEMRLRLAEAYDRWGFYSYHLAEHHFTPLCGAPSPSVFLAALSQRTTRLRFGPLVYLFPFYHPLRLAEEICMLDHLSNGRLDLGIGRGISPIESRLFGNDPASAQRIFDEARTVVLMALSGEPIEYRGETYTFDDVQMAVAPLQTPPPPLWYGTSSAETAERCATSGYHLINNDVGSAAREVANRFAEACISLGNESFRSGLTRFIVVADTDAEALRIARSAYPSWHRSFNELFSRFGRAPVQGERPAEFDPYLESGKGIVGSPETVRQIVSEQIRETGINYVVGQFAFGDISIDAALRSVELFGSQVMPVLSERTPELA